MQSASDNGHHQLLYAGCLPSPSAGHPCPSGGSDARLLPWPGTPRGSALPTTVRIASQGRMPSRPISRLNTFARRVFQPSGAVSSSRRDKRGGRAARGFLQHLPLIRYVQRCNDVSSTHQDSRHLEVRVSTRERDPCQAEPR